MEDKKREVLNEILKNSNYGGVTYITYNTIYEYSTKYGIPSDEFLIYVFNSVNNETATFLLNDTRITSGDLANKLWDNASEERKYFIAEKEWVGYLDWCDHSFQDLKYYDSAYIVLRVKMMKYITNRDKQSEMFESVAIDISHYYQYFRENTEPNLDSDDESFDWKKLYDYELMGHYQYTALEALNELWNSYSKEMQVDLFPSLIKLYEKSDKSREIENFIIHSDKEAITQHLNEILRTGIFIDYDTISNEERLQLIINKFRDANDIEKLREKLSKVFHNEETLQVMINEIKSNNNYNLSIEKIWESLFEETQKENLHQIIEMTNNKNVLQGIWNNTIFSIVQDIDTIKLFFDKYFIDKEEEWKKENFEKYLKLLTINEEINTTINFSLFDNPIFSSLSIEQVARITNYPEIQSKILDDKFDIKEKKELKIAMIQYCLAHDINMLDKLLDNIKNLDNIQFYKFPVEELTSGDTLSGLVNLCLMSENYFNVGEKSGLREDIKRDAVLNFERWRALISVAVLEDNENLYKECPKIASMDSITRKKFAMLQLKHGIDLKDAQILVRKYANGLQLASGLNDEEVEIQRQIFDIKRILSLDEKELNTMYERIKENDYQEFEDTEFIPITDLEKKCIDIYARRCSETLYLPNENDYTGTTTYENKTVNVFEVKEEFNMLVRSEGAYDFLWRAPDDYKIDIQRPKITYHGNCESYIGQNLIALARPRGPIFGYSNCSTNNLIAMAPYDLISADANTSFSSINGDKTRKGMDFRTPKEMIDRTRHGHNEVVFERVEYDGANFKKRMPDYIVWVKEDTNETENDRENNEIKKERWLQTKKAAAQLDIPIVMIDREYYAKREEEKIETMLSIYEEKTENTIQISSEKLLQEMVVQFENNATGLLFSPTLNNTYFTGDKRKQMIERICIALEEKKKINYEAYKKETISLYSVLTDETSKCFSVTGESVVLEGEREDYYSELREKLKMQIDGFSETTADRRKYLSALCEVAASKQEKLKEAEQLEADYQKVASKNMTSEHDSLE